MHRMLSGAGEHPSQGPSPGLFQGLLHHMASSFVQARCTHLTVQGHHVTLSSRNPRQLRNTTVLKPRGLDFCNNQRPHTMPWSPSREFWGSAEDVSQEKESRKSRETDQCKAPITQPTRNPPSDPSGLRVRQHSCSQRAFYILHLLFSEPERLQKRLDRTQGFHLALQLHLFSIFTYPQVNYHN